MKTMIQAQHATIMWVSDPSHSWLAVATDEDELGGFPDAVAFASQYSYLDEKVVFLEEDVDAPAFIRHYGIDVSALPQHNYDDTDHFIRALPKGQAVKEAI